MSRRTAEGSRLTSIAIAAISAAHVLVPIYSVSNLGSHGLRIVRPVKCAVAAVTTTLDTEVVVAPVVALLVGVLVVVVAAAVEVGRGVVGLATATGFQLECPGVSISSFKGHNLMGA